jgi:hypothetical protein
VTDGNSLAVNHIGGQVFSLFAEMETDLMTEKVKIDPAIRFTPRRAAEHFCVKLPGFFFIPDWGGEVKRDHFCLVT